MIPGRKTVIKDCIRMFASAFCADKRLKIKVTPDDDAVDAARFISLLSGRCEIGEYQGAALIKPLKKRPASSCAVMVPHAGRELFMLIAGIAAQMNIAVRFDHIEGDVTDEDLKHLADVTQGQLCYGRKDGAVYINSMLYDENPLFEICRESAFTAGLCLGAVLARVSTLVCVPLGEEDELLRFTLEVLAENGVTLETDAKTGETIIKTMLYTRLPEKKPADKKKKAPETET